MNAKHYTMNNGQVKGDKIEMWKALDEFQPYSNGLRLKPDQSPIDFKLKVDRWGILYAKYIEEN